MMVSNMTLRLVVFFSSFVVRPALSCGGVNYGKIKGVVVGAELHEQIKDLVYDVVGPAVFAVNLVNDDDGF